MVRKQFLYELDRNEVFGLTQFIITSLHLIEKLDKNSMLDKPYLNAVGRQWLCLFEKDLETSDKKAKKL